MLTINNIEKLEKKTIGAWIVRGVEIDFTKTSRISDNNYTIRLSRNGEKGAAIVIERKEGEFGYNVSICYESYDNVISVNAVGKNELKNKDIFLSLMRGIIDAEYDKNK
jgi:hypothetical protein